MALCCLGRSSLPFASLKTSKTLKILKVLRGSSHQALWPQAFVVIALQPAVCLHSPLLLRRSSLPFASPKTPKPLKPLKSLAAASTKHSGHKHLLLERCSRCPLLLGRSSLPFASLKTPKTLKTLKSLAAASTKHSVHKHLLLERCSLPFASKALAARLIDQYMFHRKPRISFWPFNCCCVQYQCMGSKGGVFHNSRTHVGVPQMEVPSACTNASQMRPRFSIGSTHWVAPYGIGDIAPVGCWPAGCQGPRQA